MGPAKLQSMIIGVLSCSLVSHSSDAEKARTPCNKAVRDWMRARAIYILCYIECVENDWTCTTCVAQVSVPGNRRACTAEEALEASTQQSELFPHTIESGTMFASYSDKKKNNCLRDPLKLICSRNRIFQAKWVPPPSHKEHNLIKDSKFV